MVIISRRNLFASIQRQENQFLINKPFFFLILSPILHIVSIVNKVYSGILFQYSVILIGLNFFFLILEYDSC